MKISRRWCDGTGRAQHNTAVGVLTAAAVDVVWLGVPLGCWALLRRGRAIRVGVAVTLVVLAAAVAMVQTGMIDLRARMEIVAAYAPLSAMVIGVGVVLDRHRPVAGWRWRLGAVGLSAYLGLILLCCNPFLVYVVNTDPFVPDSDELLPLPAGLTVVANRETGCGSGTCGRDIVVGSPIGQPATAIAALVVAHLTDQHRWRLDASAAGCRRTGWLLDRSILCVEVLVTNGQVVTVDLTGSRAFT